MLGSTPLQNTPLAQEPLKEPWFSHLSSQHTTGTYRSVTRLAKERQDSRLRSGPPPNLAGTLPLSRAVPPDPHGKPSLPHCPVLPSDPFVSWATHPTLSLCPLASQATHSATGHSVRSGHKGRYSNLIRGPLFRERESSFARDPLTPLARPGSIRPLSGARLSHLPLAHPMRFAPFRLPHRATPL